MNASSQGLPPLHGLRVVEFAGVGPAPFVGMMLSQLGADVLRIVRTVGTEDFLGIPEQYHFMNHGKARLAVDLKSSEGIAEVMRVVEKADVVIEGFRPGVMERLGLGPEACHQVNPRLIYGRVTGWGQQGPLSQEAGHDITYLALSGVLGSIGEAGGRPVPPLNLLGDFAGGGLYLVIGILAALHGSRQTRRGQVIDAAMLDGVVHLNSFIFGLRQAGMWNLERGQNSADGGHPFYGTYETADGKWLAVAAVEPKFRAAFIQALQLPEDLARKGDDQAFWPEVKLAIAAVLRERTRDDWAERLTGIDACVAPVLHLDEVATHPHVVSRQLFDSEAGVHRPVLAPKFSESFQAPATSTGEEMLARWQ